MDNSIIEAAIQWAKRGVPVFPCGMDKSPLTKNGHLDATTDLNKVRELFEFYGDNVMIGARMGAESKLFACDFDLYKEGAKEYMEELAERGLLTDTQMHTTRSGGVHLIYRSDKAYPNCKPHAGVEIKGEGGYIIVPPSAGYKIEQRGIAYAPEELINEFMNARKAASKTGIDKLKQNILSATDFHDSLAMLAARRSAQGWTQEAVQKELIDVLAASVASNPKHARHDRWRKLSQDDGGELARLAASSHSKYNQTAYTEKARETVKNDFIKNIAESSAGFFGARDPLATQPQIDTASSEQKVLEQVPLTGDLIEEWPFQSDGYFSGDDREILNQKYVMYPLFAERETMLIAAEPKAGKTAIALRIAIAIAHGESLGTQLAVAEPRPVLYFTLEGARAVEMRIAAERGYRKDRGEEWPRTDRLFVVDRPQNFLDRASQVATCAKIIAHDRKCASVYGASLGVIFIDTLTKAMPSGDQNSVEDTSQLFQLVDILRSNGVTATIVFVHHLSKQGEVRGSTNIEAEVDVVASVEKTKTQGIVKLNIRRARSIDESISYMFKLSSYYLGETVQGHRLHAPVVSLHGEEDVTTTGEAARAAAKWQQMCQLVIEKLGTGKWVVDRLFAVLCDGGFIERPAAKRPRMTSDAVQKPLKSLFDGKHTWSFGNYWLAIHRDANGLVDFIEIRDTK